MANFSWKQAVADCVLDIVNRSGHEEFELGQVYQYTPLLGRRFPRNRHVTDKIRQTLQLLRNDGFLSFTGRGKYSLVLDYDDIVVETGTLANREKPQTQRVVRTVRLRDTFLASEIKRRYRCMCQVCRGTVALARGMTYAEGHHLKPLGSPHHGPDIESNIIVLCPNHHVMFDRGAAMIDANTLIVRHADGGVFEPNLRLYVEPWHTLRSTFLRYHEVTMFKRTG